MRIVAKSWMASIFVFKETVMRDSDRRIVVVDDDAAVRDSLAFLLETAGYAVESFASGPLCLRAIKPTSVACLVVDQHMPEMTGLEFLAELHHQGIHLPALLITGSPSPDLLARAAALDVRQVLAKPLAEDDLLRLIGSMAP